MRVKVSGGADVDLQADDRSLAYVRALLLGLFAQITPSDIDMHM